MKRKWIPRNARWSVEERKQKQIQAKNKRELNHLFYSELMKFREEIEKEIQKKKLAKIATLE